MQLTDEYIAVAKDLGIGLASSIINETSLVLYPVDVCTFSIE